MATPRTSSALARTTRHSRRRQFVVFIDEGCRDLSQLHLTSRARLGELAILLNGGGKVVLHVVFDATSLGAVREVKGALDVFAPKIQMYRCRILNEQVFTDPGPSCL